MEKRLVSPIIAVVAATVLSAVVLVGCSGGGGAPSQSAESSANTNSAETSSANSTDESSTNDTEKSKSSSKQTLTADRILSIESVETEQDSRYTHKYVAYKADVTVKNISDGTLNINGEAVEDVSIKGIGLIFLDEDNNIVDTGNAHMSNGDGITLTQGQSAKFDAVIETGKGISQIQITSANIELGGKTGKVDFADPSSLIFPVVSPLGTVD